MNNKLSRLTLVLASVLTLGYARAAEPVRLNSNERPAIERSLQRQLNRHLSFPVMETGNMTGKVYVSFVVDKEGKLEVISCASENERLRAYVLRKLARVDIGENPDGIWKTTHMVFDFHPEKS
jgi:hypothetical protein